MYTISYYAFLQFNVFEWLPLIDSIIISISNSNSTISPQI